MSTLDFMLGGSGRPSINGYTGFNNVERGDLAPSVWNQSDGSIYLRSGVISTNVSLYPLAHSLGQGAVSDVASFTIPSGNHKLGAWDPQFTNYWIANDSTNELERYASLADITANNPAQTYPLNAGNTSPRGVTVQTVQGGKVYVLDSNGFMYRYSASNGSYENSFDLSGILPDLNVNGLDYDPLANRYWIGSNTTWAARVNSTLTAVDLTLDGVGITTELAQPMVQNQKLVTINPSTQKAEVWNKTTGEHIGSYNIGSSAGQTMKDRDGFGYISSGLNMNLAVSDPYVGDPVERISDSGKILYVRVK